MMVDKGDSGCPRWRSWPVACVLLASLLGVAGPALAAPPTATFSWTITPAPTETVRATCTPSDPDGSPATCTWLLQAFDRNSPLTFSIFSFSNVFPIEIYRWTSLDLCFVLTATVEDADGESTVYEDPIAALPTCEASNAAPTLTLGPDTWKLPAKPFVLDITLDDPDAGDTHTLTIDWGDGTSETLAAHTGAIAAQHTYHGTGTWTLEACAEDASGASSCDTLVLEQRGSHGRLDAAHHPGKGKAKGLA